MPDLEREVAAAATQVGVVKPLQNQIPAESTEYIDALGGAQAPSTDLFAILKAVLRRWKLVSAITLSALIATYGGLKLVPARYKSTVEILVYDPQGQIDATVQKPISPFVEALNNDAMNTEINILKSKSVALRVARELGLDRDPEFRPQHPIANLVEQSYDRIAALAERLGFPGLGLAFSDSRKNIGDTEDKAAKLDQVADVLLKNMDVWQDSYIINVSTTSRDPIEAQRLASTIANDYLASQREARQEALNNVATWLKRRVDDLQSQILETESAIEKLKVESGIRDSESDKVREEQIGVLTTQLMAAREEVEDKRSRLEQARQVVAANGDIDSIPALSGPRMAIEIGRNNGDIESVPELSTSAAFSGLRLKQMELNQNLTLLQSKFGEHNIQVISIRAQLATVNKEMAAETGRILGVMKNAYDIAVRREQKWEANLQSLTANQNSEAYIKLQQLRQLADADRSDYQTYLTQYNDISEKRELQNAGAARIISPASLPREPSKNRMKFYALGGLAGLGGGFMLAFLLEYFRPGVKSSTEVEQTFRLPVVGTIPLVSGRKSRDVSPYRLLDGMVHEPLSQLSETVRAMRISLDLLSANPKVILVTSALSGEGKSTAAMLLAASSASSGKRTILLDCDFRQRSTSETLRRLRSKDRPGLSELLRGTAELEDVIIEDPVTKIHAIPAGSIAPNPADLLMSQGMLDLIAVLRSGFDYIVMDAPPLLPVVDALALATVADKILVIVEWRRTPHTSIHEAFRILGQEANRVAGVVLNKVEFNQLPVYGGYHYRSIAKYYGNA